MSEERLRILQMVAEGKVSPEDAVALLEALEPADRRGGGAWAGYAAAPPMPPAPPIPPAPGMVPIPPLPAFAVANGRGGLATGSASAPVAARLRISARDEGGNEMNVVWPLGMVKGMAGMVPGWARDLFEKCGLDFGAVAQGDVAQFGAEPGELFSVRTEGGDEVKVRLE